MTTLARDMAESSTFTAVVDTNVTVDIYTSGDLFREYERRGIADLDHPQLRYRRARARESLLLAACFHRQNALTYSLHREGQDQVTLSSPPADRSSFSTAYTTIFVHFVLGRVLSGWQDAYGNENDAGLHGTECDDRLLAAARDHGLPLITNEGFTADGVKDGKPRGLRAKAIAAGVRVFTPREFWSGKIDEHAEIRDFLDRFRMEAPAYVRTSDRPSIAQDTLETILAYYQHIFLGITEGVSSPVKVTVP